MKCRKQFKYHKIPITNLWEVQLDENLWQRISAAADSRRCTFSWITRYCVFRLAMRSCLKMRFAMEFHSNRIKKEQKQFPKKHRHIICLYGEDEKILRNAAQQLGISVSQMIRLALYWFLPKVEEMKVKWAEIFYRGTKICRYFDIYRKNNYRMPFIENIFYTKWPIEMWWKRPRYSIAIPYSPENLNHQIYKQIIPIQDDDS